MRGQHRLATAGGDAQAHAGQIVAKRPRMPGAARLFAERTHGALDPRRAGKGGQSVERGLLVGLEGDGSHGRWFPCALRYACCGDFGLSGWVMTMRFCASSGRR